MNNKKQILKIAFTDGGHLCQKLVFDLLSDIYNCVIDQNNPDLLIYSLYGNKYKTYSCKKLLINGENSFPNFNECDYAITSNYLNFENRHCRIPFYVFNKEYQLLLNNEKLKNKNAFNRKFCSAVISNNINADSRRLEFLKKLHSIKNINSIGKCFNTTGYTIDNRPIFAENLENNIYTNPIKISYISNFKFNIAFENSSGYCTKKITDAFIANTIPIYFGDPCITNEFNSNTFINILDFDNFDKAIEFILKVDSNETIYNEMLSLNPIKNFDYLLKLKNFLINVINGKIFEHKYGNIAVRNSLCN